MHQIHIFPEMSFLLEVSPNILDLETTRVFARSRNLSEKEEFHVTIIGRATGESIIQYLELLSPEERNMKQSQIQELCTSYNPHIEMKPEFYSIQKDYSTLKDPIIDIRESIIQIASMDGLDAFYEKLFKIISLKFSTLFPHVTLYTTSTRADKKLRGIGIYSEADFWDMKPTKL